MLCVFEVVEFAFFIRWVWNYPSFSFCWIGFFLHNASSQEKPQLFLPVLLFSRFLFCCYVVNSVLLMTWVSRWLDLFGFWCSSPAASMTLILGFFGSADLQLGPNCSRLIRTNTFFVQNIKVIYLIASCNSHLICYLFFSFVLSAADAKCAVNWLGQKLIWSVIFLLL